MFKTTIKILKYAKTHTRSSSFSLLFLVSLCIFLTLVAHNAHAATNPGGTTVNMMEATLTDPILNNYGDIIGGSNVTTGMYGRTTTNQNFNFSNNNNINIHTIVNRNTSTYGMYAYGTGNHTLINSGTITNTISSPHHGVVVMLYTHGMRAEGVGNHSLTNSGTINVNSTISSSSGGGVGHTYGMRAEGVGNHSLTNSGIINVTAIANVAIGGVATAYGMYVSGSNTANGVHILNNTGHITARGIYEQIGTINASEAAGNTSYSVGTWATTLRPLTTSSSVFCTIGTIGSGIVANLANSTLIFRPQVTAAGVELGVNHALDNLVVNSDMRLVMTAIDTKLGKIEAEVPFLKAVVTDTGGRTTSSTSVRLESNVSEETTPGAATMQQALSQVQGQFNNLSTSLRNALVEIYNEANLVADAEQNGTSGIAAGSNYTPKSKWQVFINPYANTVNNSKYDYNGNNMGITAGASYRVNDNFSFGGHLDFSSANYYGELMDMSTKSTSFALGLHAAYNFTPECYLRGQLTGSVNQNDNYFTASPTLNGDANYNGEAVYMELATGYTWQIARNNTSAHSLTPEIGLSYLGTHTGAYDVEWSGPAGSMYDMSYDDSYYNAFYGTLRLDWRSEWELKNDASIALLAGLGLRQTLSNGEMETSFRSFGSNFTTTSTEDLTTFLADVGVEYKKGNFSVSLNYDGGFGDAQTSHGGNVMVKLEF